MKFRRLVLSASAVAMLAAPVLAQTAPQQPSGPARSSSSQQPAPAQPAAPARATAPAQPAQAQPAQKPAPAAAQQAPIGKKININTASADELDKLKGIGPARAEKIIQERKKSRIKDFNDLVQRNILPSNVEADIRNQITF